VGSRQSRASPAIPISFSSWVPPPCSSSAARRASPTVLSSSCGRTPSFFAAAMRRRPYSASLSAASFRILLPAEVALPASGFAFGRRTGRPFALIFVMGASAALPGGGERRGTVALAVGQRLNRICRSGLRRAGRTPRPASSQRAPYAPPLQRLGRGAEGAAGRGGGSGAGAGPPPRWLGTVAPHLAPAGGQPLVEPPVDLGHDPGRGGTGEPDRAWEVAGADEAVEGAARQSRVALDAADA
jgi:hypothetical protein